MASLFDFLDSWYKLSDFLEDQVFDTLGLFFLVLGAFSEILRKSTRNSVKKEQNVSEKKIKRIMSLYLFLVFLLFSVICIIVLEDRAFHRFLFSIAVINGAISVRAFFYVPIFKGEWEEKVNRMEVARHYTFYSIMITIISCLLYLGFHEVINDLTNWHFYSLALILFACMGFVAPTVVQKTGINV